VTNSTAPVSVIIPTFNRKDSVCLAIQSVLNQTLPPAEIIVVDDGSNDNTSNVVVEQFPNVKLIQQENHGVSHARNRGIEIASQNWIALLDSDDRWLPNKLAVQMRAIADNGPCVLCHCDEIWIRNGTRVNPMNKHKKRGGDIFEYCLPLCAISPSAVILRKTLLNKLGGFDETLPACEDYDLWLRITAQHDVVFVDELLLEKTGGHQDQLSRQYWGMDRFRLKALAKMLRSDNLNESQREKTLTTFNKKFRILLKGAEKHNNATLAIELNELYSDIITPTP